MSTLHKGLHDKLGPYIFHIFIGFEGGVNRLFIVPNLKSIHAVFAMLWPFQWMLVSCFSTDWSVAKLFGGVYIYYMYIKPRGFTTNLYLILRAIYLNLCWSYGLKWIYLTGNYSLNNLPSIWDKFYSSDMTSSDVNWISPIATQTATNGIKLMDWCNNFDIYNGIKKQSNLHNYTLTGA